MEIDEMEVMLNQVYFFHIQFLQPLDSEHLALMEQVIRTSKQWTKEPYLSLQKAISRGPQNHTKMPVSTGRTVYLCAPKKKKGLKTMNLSNESGSQMEF